MNKNRSKIATTLPTADYNRENKKKTKTHPQNGQPSHQLLGHTLGPAGAGRGSVRIAVPPGPKPMQSDGFTIITD